MNDDSTEDHREALARIAARLFGTPEATDETDEPEDDKPAAFVGDEGSNPSSTPIQDAREVARVLFNN